MRNFRRGVTAAVLGMLVYVVGGSVALATGSGCSDALAHMSEGGWSLICDGECPNSNPCGALQNTNETTGVTSIACVCWNGGNPYIAPNITCVNHIKFEQPSGYSLFCSKWMCPGDCPEDPVLIPENPPSGDPKYGCPCQ